MALIPKIKEFIIHLVAPAPLVAPNGNGCSVSVGQNSRSVAEASKENLTSMKLLTAVAVTMLLSAFMIPPFAILCLSDMQRIVSQSILGPLRHLD